MSVCIHIRSRLAAGYANAVVIAPVTYLHKFREVFTKVSTGLLMKDHNRI